MKNRILVLDTETCNLVKSDKVIPGNNITYDIGFFVVEPATGSIVKKYSYVVSEIFFGEVKRLKSAYYADKLPQYCKDIADNKRIVKSFFNIMNEIYHLIKTENIIAICAHNARFDIDALNTTLRHLTGLDYVTALPDIEIWDSMKMWNACKPKQYDNFCEEHGLMTKHTPPRSRMTAEAIYRFLIDDNTFEESHTAMEDVAIETEIILACYKSHKPFAKERILYNKRERA